ncbi:hypothetical protein GLAREA_03470 [Glarea lozoyensis ATCC 20868]|uniref:Uncharacterized protein n=1 Tax=Glarea lozoyensis (strain ATCC 20868 / MF5171) TaxID=1116229 RepID=S3DVT4_GLAL2|nr:uncharacterized protein GLAREA_03470 [Glarea lozoyensis ATCC 20868]EPE30503.1 hypothetical protein GLAREA_03470 [Glarea lozoyensis ATCC 20868]
MPDGDSANDAIQLDSPSSSPTAFEYLGFEYLLHFEHEWNELENWSEHIYIKSQDEFYAPAFEKRVQDMIQEHYNSPSLQPQTDPNVEIIRISVFPKYNEKIIEARSGSAFPKREIILIIPDPTQLGHKEIDLQDSSTTRIFVSFTRGTGESSEDSSRAKRFFSTLHV